MFSGFVSPTVPKLGLSPTLPKLCLDRDYLNRASNRLFPGEGQTRIAAYQPRKNINHGSCVLGAHTLQLSSACVP